jgi:hypothetical protein
VAIFFNTTRGYTANLKKVVLQKSLTLSMHEMLGNFHLEPKTQEFYIATMPKNI